MRHFYMHIIIHSTTNLLISFIRFTDRNNRWQLYIFLWNKKKMNRGDVCVFAASQAIICRVRNCNNISLNFFFFFRIKLYRARRE